MLEFLRKYRILIVLGGLLLGALIFFSLWLRRQNTPSPFERQVLALTAPIQGAISLGVSGAGRVGENLFGGGAELLQAQDKVRKLEAQLVDLEESRQETLRLRKLLEFGIALENRTVAARVIGVDATSWFRTVVIDRGSRDGLQEGMAVVTDQGVVGRVTTCAPSSSRVVLAIDAASRIATLIERTRARGICRGTGESMILDYVPMTEDVKDGDLLVTSGLGGAFPKGMVVGRVVSVARRGFDMFQTIQVEPAIDFERIEEVLVVIPSGAPPLPPTRHAAPGRL